jgi:hypothetical protein
MPIKIGFKETKEAIDLAIALGRGIEKSLGDDKIDFTDIPNFIPATMVLFQAIDGIEAVPLEFNVSSKEEIEELKAYVQSQLDLDDDKLEAFIEDSFKVLLDIFVIYKGYFAPVEPTAADTTTDEATISEDN